MKHSTKRAAVYDRWLHTLGGGEQLAFAFATTLHKMGYQTELLTHQKFDIAEAERKLKTNLKNISIRYLPSLPDYQLSQYTEDYDVFVSNSYLDYIPNRSKFGILCVFFPSKINLSIYEYLKRAHIVPSLRKLFIYPSEFEGFKYDEYKKGVLHKWLSKESSIRFNQPIKKVSITLCFKFLAFSCLDQIVFSYGEKRIEPLNRSVNHLNNTASYNFVFPHSDTSHKLSITIPEGDFCRDVSLIRLSIPHFRYFIYNWFKHFFPKWEMRLHGGPSVTRYSDIESYSKLVTISKFSQHWLQKYWGMKSQLLYPAVAVEEFYIADKKKNVISHVGRFFVGGHSKKQLDLVRVFKQMVNNGLSNWEFHLIGGVAPGEIHQEYVNKIKNEIEGYPIFLHLDAPFSELKEILSVTKIYWHATGLDESNDKAPILMEHFGITTVEAMAAGCVPVVINRGGQPEVVTAGTGFIWETREELISYTNQLIADAALLNKMSKAALQRSTQFNKNRFYRELEDILKNEK